MATVTNAPARDPRTKGSDVVSTPGGTAQSGELDKRREQLSASNEVTEELLLTLIRKFREIQLISYDPQRNKEILRDDISLVLQDRQARASDPSLDSKRARRFDVLKERELFDMAQVINQTLLRLEQSDPFANHAIRAELEAANKVQQQKAKVASAGSVTESILEVMKDNGTEITPEIRQAVMAKILDAPDPQDVVSSMARFDKNISDLARDYGPENLDALIARYPSREKLIRSASAAEQSDKVAKGAIKGTGRVDVDRFMQPDNLIRSYDRMVRTEQALLTLPDLVPSQQGNLFGQLTGQVSMDFEDLPPFQSIVDTARLRALDSFRKYVENNVGERFVDRAMKRLPIQPDIMEMWQSRGELTPEQFTEETEEVRKDAMAQLEGMVERSTNVLSGIGNAP